MPPLSIMIKPASSICNMACDYCFYHDVAALRSEDCFGIMSRETTDRLIESALEFAKGESISFAFQGGEPLFAGIGYFKHFVSRINELNRYNSRIYLSIQTNGTLVTDEWAEFFAEKKFLVGLSLDGDKQANKFRKTADGKATFDSVIRTTEIFNRYGVDYNILCVLTGYCAENIDMIYSFYKSKNFRYLQFIPCLRPFADNTKDERYMSVEEYKYFLIHAFNAYVKDYIRGEYTSVRQFDNMVQMYLGREPEQCGMCGHCSHQFVVEGNGNVYPCDFYCLDEWLLGNINTTGLKEMAQSQKAIDFIQESLEIDEKCKKCTFYKLCRGAGCKRNRISENYCEAYKTFFSACLPLFRVFINE